MQSHILLGLELPILGLKLTHVSKRDPLFKRLFMSYFSSTYQVHLMWSTKLLGLVWTWTQKYATPHEINKHYELNWTNINVYHVSAMLKYVTVSFRSMKASRLYPQWMQFPQTFLCMNFNVKKYVSFFPRNICQAQVFGVFVCVCTCTNLLLLNTEVNNDAYELSSNGAHEPVLVSGIRCTDQQCLFIEINTFELSWEWCHQMETFSA